MGTKVQLESYFPGIPRVRDVADDSNSYNCLVYSGDKTFTNGQYYNGHLHSGHDKDLVKRTMLEHEAMFRNQLYELHRLYRIQRDMMNEVKMNGSTLRNVEMLESRPTKARRKMFDLRLPADEYIDTEDVKPLAKGNPCNSSKNSFDQNNCQVDLSLPGPRSRVKTSMADLNEPIVIEDTGTSEHTFHAKIRGTKFNDKQKSRLEFSSEEIWQKLRRGSDDNSSNWNREAVISSRISTQHKFVPDSSKPNSMLYQTAVHLNSSSALRQSSDLSAQSIGIFGDRWNCNNISTSNQKFGSERSYQNGYYSHKISAGCKELQHLTPPGSYDHLNWSTADNLATDHLIKHGSEKFYRGSSNKAASRRGIEVIDLERNDDNNGSWAISAPQHKESFLEGSTGCHRKILGFPIFQDAHVPKKETSYFTFTSLSIPHRPEVKVGSKVNKLQFDMNIPSDEMGIATEEKDAKASNFRCEIDLNSCISEDEASLLPSVPDSKKKKFTGIDLEAPIVPEGEEEEVSVHGGECMARDHEEHSSIRVAAEAIIAISLSASQDQWPGSNCSLPEEVSAAPDPLRWFADIITAWKVRDNDSSSFEELDYFESMTLKLAETKEEDYIAKPLVPEGLKLDETGTSHTQTQRGNARRGRQRRDFQRDILPGLGSLSRHEVTEDLQTFGALMRATGVTWHARNSTRSGSGRGRRRSLMISPPPPCNPLIQQLSSVEAGLEDTSLRGWGKTTRRPRRQRCPTGNLPTIPVT